MPPPVVGLTRPAASPTASTRSPDVFAIRPKRQIFKRGSENLTPPGRRAMPARRERRAIARDFVSRSSIRCERTSTLPGARAPASRIHPALPHDRAGSRHWRRSGTGLRVARSGETRPACQDRVLCGTDSSRRMRARPPVRESLDRSLRGHHDAVGFDPDAIDASPGAYLRSCRAGPLDQGLVERAPVPRPRR